MRAQLLDSTQLQTAHQTIKNLMVKFDGPLFEMGGGSAQLAAGVEYHRLFDERRVVARAWNRAREHELLHRLSSISVET